MGRTDGQTHRINGMHALIKFPELLYFIKELLVSDLGLELYVLTVMPMRYARLSGTDFFVFVRGLVYFNIACTSRCAPLGCGYSKNKYEKKNLQNLTPL